MWELVPMFPKETGLLLKGTCPPGKLLYPYVDNYKWHHRIMKSCTRQSKIPGENLPECI